MFRWKNKKLDARDKSKLLKHWGSYGILAVALFAMTFFGVCTPSGQQVGPRGSAGRVAGEVISDLEFRRTYQNLYQTYSQRFRDNFDPAKFNLSSQALEQLVQQRVTLLAARELGVTVTEDEIVDMLRSRNEFNDEKGQFNPEYFRTFLRRNVFTEKSFMENLRRSMTVQKYVELASAASFVSTKTSELDYKLQNTKLEFEYIKFTPQLVSTSLSEARVNEFVTQEAQQIEDYYKANVSEYSQPEQVKARHILIAFKGSRNASSEAAKRTKEEAQKLATQVLAQAKKAGADFAALAKSKTDEPSGKGTGGDLGWFSREKMVAAFSEAAFKLKPNQISDIVETPFGFHIIKAEGRKAAKTTTLEQAKNQIARKILREKEAPKLLAEKANTYLQALQAGKSVQSLLNKDKLKWQKTGEVSLISSYISGLGADAGVVSKALSVKKVGSFVPEVLGQDNKFIVRLKSRKAADLSKMNAETQENRARSLGYRQANRILKALEKEKRQALDDSGRIWLSKSHREYDQERQSGG